MMIFSQKTKKGQKKVQSGRGLGRLENGRIGLIAPNIVRLGGDLKETHSTYSFGGLKEGLWRLLC